ncbi:MAG: type II secretion system F family protein [Atopobiaceae bacterium]|nr:type II secretion system F family protein [Atopobiaceae bacterium]
MVFAVAASALAFMAAFLSLGGGPIGSNVSDSVLASIRAIRLLAPFRVYEERVILEGRRRACLMQLPVLLDVLTLGLSAGLSFDASLELYCTRYDDELAHALSEAMASWRIGLTTRSEALSALARRLDISALQRFSSTVTEALVFGSPLVEVLEHQAQSIRDEHRSHVEEAIEKVPVKMLIPLGTLIVPAMLLAILGPLMGPALRSV